MKVKLFKSSYLSYKEDNYDSILEGVTEWEECTPEEFKYLQQYSYQLGFWAVSQIEKEEFKTTLAKVMAIIQEKQEAEQKRKKKSASEEAARKEKARLRAIAKAEKLLKENGKL